MMLIYICVPFGGLAVQLMSLKTWKPWCQKRARGQGAQNYKSNGKMWNPVYGIRLTPLMAGAHVTCPDLRKFLQWATSDYADDIVAHENDSIAKFCNHFYSYIFCHLVKLLGELIESTSFFINSPSGVHNASWFLILFFLVTPIG